MKKFLVPLIGASVMLLVILTSCTSSSQEQQPVQEVAKEEQVAKPVELLQVTRGSPLFNPPLFSYEPGILQMAFAWDYHPFSKTSFVIKALPDYHVLWFNRQEIVLEALDPARLCAEAYADPACRQFAKAKADGSPGTIRLKLEFVPEYSTMGR